MLIGSFICLSRTFLELSFPSTVVLGHAGRCFARKTPQLALKPVLIIIIGPRYVYERQLSVNDFFLARAMPCSACTYIHAHGLAPRLFLIIIFFVLPIAISITRTTSPQSF